MATVDKNFKVKHGLIVEGTTATVNGEDIITTGSTTDSLPEGTTNLYFTNQRALDAVGGDISSAVSTAINALTTDDIEEGTANKYFTDQRAVDANTGLWDQAGAAQDALNSANNYTNGEISSAITTAQNYADGLASNYDPAGAAYTAETNAKNYADLVGGSAEANAKSYADGLASNYDPAGAAGAVAGDLSTHITDTSTHGVNGDIVGTSDAQTLSNKEFNGETKFHAANGAGTFSVNLDNTTGAATLKGNNGNLTINAYGGALVLSSMSDSYIGSQASGNEIATKGYVDGLAANYDLAGAAATAEANANDYTDTAVANLVDGAPALLDTLNELAAAIADNPNYATDVANLVAGKQDTLTAGTGITLTGSTISVTSNTYDAYGAASTAESNANTYTDNAISGLNLSSTYDAYGSAATAEQNAKDYADITFVPVTEKGQAGGVATLDGTGNVPLTQLGNVPAAYITSVGTNLDVTGQQLTVSSTPQFDSVKLGWYATEVQGYATANATDTVYPIALGNGASAKLVVRAMSNATGHSQMSEILVTKDSNNNIAITEYAIVGTNGSLGDVSAVWDGTAGIKISFTAVENQTEIMVSGTSYVWND